MKAKLKEEEAIVAALIVTEHQAHAVEGTTWHRLLQSRLLGFPEDLKPQPALRS